MAQPPSPRRANPRLAAGRARSLGLPTRGTTNPNRLRRMDNWICARLGGVLGAAADPLVVDLGYGATPITAVELAARLARVRNDVRVVGLELDPARVASALGAADAPRLSFARGGFELAGLRPTVVRAANVLRQYDESAAADAWRVMQTRLAPRGVLVEGTCDETGRRACWVLLDAAGPKTLTLAGNPATIARPSELAERLPKVLIHRNVAGEPIHAFLRELDAAWDVAAALAAFGAWQRWRTACASLAERWPVDTSRSRHGELTVAWTAIAPSGTNH